VVVQEYLNLYKLYNKYLELIYQERLIPVKRYREGLHLLLCKKVGCLNLISLLFAVKAIFISNFCGDKLHLILILLSIQINKL
jgi:hypothetical protein